MFNSLKIIHAMNKEDLVTYEQALALKKLGFDLKVNHYYDDEGYIIENLADYSEEVPDGEYTSYDNFNYEDFCSAPTLEQAQKWLRKYKDLIVIPHPRRDCKGNVVWYFTIFNSGNYKYSSEYNSYEESLSAGITECIKLLEK